MAPLQAPCPEGCGGFVKKPGHKTCGSRSCQGKRQRRIARARKASGEQTPYAPELQAVQKAAARDAKDAAADVLREELRPVVREALTADVLHSLQGMVALVPKAIETLGKDLECKDALVRERARETVLRYTLGHRSIQPPTADQQPSPMTVVLNVPGSGASAEVALATPHVVVAEAEEIRECMECRLQKADSEFVAGSDRCQACHDAKMAEIEARFGPQG